RRLDARTGREKWNTPLGSMGQLAFAGEAASDDLVVATVKPADEEARYATAVALDPETGRELWRARLDSADAMHPTILTSVVAYELIESLERGARSRVVLLDRRTGKLVQEIEHPTIGKTYERVEFGADWMALYSNAELAVY